MKNKLLFYESKVPKRQTFKMKIGIRGIIWLGINKFASYFNYLIQIKEICQKRKLPLMALEELVD